MQRILAESHTVQTLALFAPANCTVNRDTRKPPTPLITLKVTGFPHPDTYIKVKVVARHPKV